MQSQKPKLAHERMCERSLLLVLCANQYTYPSLSLPWWWSCSLYVNLTTLRHELRADINASPKYTVHALMLPKAL